MRQSDLDRAVARATGESVRAIQALGFSLLSFGPAGGQPRERSLRRDQRDRRQCASARRLSADV
jgi:hypothetical protein